MPSIIQLATCGNFHILSNEKCYFLHIPRNEKEGRKGRVGYLTEALSPDAHYSECHDKPSSLQIQLFQVHLKLNCGFLFFAAWALMG